MVPWNSCASAVVLFSLTYKQSNRETVLSTDKAIQSFYSAKVSFCYHWDYLHCFPAFWRSDGQVSSESLLASWLMLSSQTP